MNIIEILQTAVGVNSANLTPQDLALRSTLSGDNSFNKKAS